MKSNLYFNHDFNARNDPKLKRLQRLKGHEAKGIYWDLIEILCEEGGYYPLSQLDDIAYEEHLDGTELLNWLVYDSGLFLNDGERFWSARQLKDQTRREAIAEKRRESGAAGGRARTHNAANAGQNGSENNSEAEQTLSNCQANAQAINKEINKEIDNSSISEDILVVEGPTTHKEIPYKQIQDLWNATVARSGMRLAKIATLAEARKNKIAVRWKEMKSVSPGGDPLEVLKDVFAKTAASKFLCGDNRNSWKASFDWIFENGKNWVKVYEGNYDDNRPSGNDDKQGVVDKWK